MDLSELEYPNTVLSWFDGSRVDLREPIGARELAAFASNGLCNAFAILSAYPAPSQARPREQSELLTARLRAEIRALDAPCVDLVASSPCGAHTEPSVAAPLSRRDALVIARQFEQSAVFWFDGARMWIDWTDGRPSTALPLSPPTVRVQGARAELDESGAH